MQKNKRENLQHGKRCMVSCLFASAKKTKADRNRWEIASNIQDKNGF